MSERLDTVALARAVDAAASAAPGVRRVFSTQPGAVRAARQIASAEPDAVPLSTASVTDTAVEITVSVGVDAGRESAETARLVADAVRVAVAASGLPPESTAVHVRVSRVEP